MKTLLSAVILLALPAVSSAGMLPDYQFTTSVGNFAVHFDRTDIPANLQYALNGTLIDQASPSLIGGGRYFEDPNNPALGHDTHGWVILPAISGTGTLQPTWAFSLDLTNPAHWTVSTSPTSDPNMIVFGHVSAGQSVIKAIQSFATADLWDLHAIPVDGTGKAITTGFNPLAWGDANMDGSIDSNDLTIVLNNFGMPLTNWADGNFDGQPTIDLTDLSLVLNNFGNPGKFSFSSEPPVSPEPASLPIAGGAVILAVRRKR